MTEATRKRLQSSGTGWINKWLNNNKLSFYISDHFSASFAVFSLLPHLCSWWSWDLAQILQFFFWMLYLGNCTHLHLKKYIIYMLMASTFLNSAKISPYSLNCLQFPEQSPAHGRLLNLWTCLLDGSLPWASGSKLLWASSAWISHKTGSIESPTLPPPNSQLPGCFLIEWTCHQHGCPHVPFSSVQSLSRVRLFVTPWTAACQASLSIAKSTLDFHTILDFFASALYIQLATESSGFIV